MIATDIHGDGKDTSVHFSKEVDPDSKGTPIAGSYLSTWTLVEPVSDMDVDPQFVASC